MESIPASIRSLLNGAWYDGLGSTEPLHEKYSGAVVAEILCVTQTQVQDTVRVATAAAERGAPAAHDRAGILERAAGLVDERRGRLASVMQAEAGFTAADAENEVARCVQTLRLCAEEARRLCGEMVPMEGAPGQTGRLGFTLRVPVGVVCAITPFNSPLNTVAHKVAPAFAAGNAVILKPSLYTPVTANLLGEILLEAGLPADFFAIVHGGAEVGQWLLQEPGIGFVAFTGSTQAGRRIQASLGLRRSQMELGSIAHTIIDDRVDLERAIPRVVNAAYRKAGQVCTSIQVLLVHEKQLGEVTKRLSERVATLAYGDPRAPNCLVGPLISERAAMRVEAWVEEALSAGAKRLVGGRRAKTVVPPTLLADTSPDMKVRCDEVFGPVLSIVPFARFEDAVSAVNASPYGLSVGVFTESVQNALRAARTLRVGAVHINEASSSRADLMPFGGSKDSGFGREGPRYAIREMSEERLITLT